MHILVEQNHSSVSPFLVVDDVDVYYGAMQALFGVSLHVQRGEVVSVLGGNASGKSTTLKTVLGLVSPSRGRVVLEGREIQGLSSPEVIDLGVASVPEGRRVFPDLTVAENLKMGGFFLSREHIEAGLERVYGLFPRLKERASQRAGTMSGGEQQMLAIGRALMTEPKLLLLDEPTLGLAPLIIAQIFEIIKEIREQGVTVFLVEQNAHKALQVADRGYVLETGKVVLADTGQNLLTNDEVRKAYLGA